MLYKVVNASMNRKIYVIPIVYSYLLHWIYLQTCTERRRRSRKFRRERQFLQFRLAFSGAEFVVRRELVSFSLTSVGAKSLIELSCAKFVLPKRFVKATNLRSGTSQW